MYDDARMIEVKRTISSGAEGIGGCTVNTVEHYEIPGAAADETILVHNNFINTRRFLVIIDNR